MQHIYFNPSELNRTRRNVFFLHPTQAYSSTQTFSSPCRGPSRPTRPYGRFLSTVITHAVLLVHTDVFSPLLQSIQVNPSTQKKPTQAYQSILYPTKGSLLSPGGHFESTHLSRHLGTYSCPQGHLEATRVPSPLRVRLISIRTFEGYSSLPSFTITKGCYFPTGPMEIALLHNVIS